MTTFKGSKVEIIKWYNVHFGKTFEAEAIKIGDSYYEIISGNGKGSLMHISHLTK